MKKIFLVLFLAISVSSFAQEIVTLTSGTIANSAKPVVYVGIGSKYDQILDSIAIQIVYTGEIDIDKLIITKGGATTVGANLSSTTFEAIATPDTTTLTINEDSAGIAAGVYTATSTGLNNLEGYDAIKISLEAASSGNDATDPNKYLIKLFKYYRSSKNY